jgi:hypothetical protein
MAARFQPQLAESQRGRLGIIEKHYSVTSRCTKRGIRGCLKNSSGVESICLAANSIHFLDSQILLSTQRIHVVFPQRSQLHNHRNMVETPVCQVIQQ